MLPPFPKAVVLRHATRAHRLHHFLWHETRNRWNLPLNPNGLTEEAKTKLRELNWEPPHPALDANRRPILNNLSGEDFLYMHRRMIEKVNDQLREVGDPNYPRVEGWRTIPEPSDSDYPVPPAWYISTIADTAARRQANERLQIVKADHFFFTRMRFWERQFTDPTHVRGMSLGEFGARVEFTIHNQLHNRFSAQPYGDRPAPDPDPTGSVPEAWDDPRYDYLGDTYASHVNTVFWKVHGWVDDRIEDWRAANAVFGPIPWQGTWEGVVPTIPGLPGPSVARAAAHEHDHDLHQLEEAARIVGSCPGGYSFLDLGWQID